MLFVLGSLPAVFFWLYAGGWTRLRSNFNFFKGSDSEKGSEIVPARLNLFESPSYLALKGRKEEGIAVIYIL
jgi:hypothetical protein